MKKMSIFGALVAIYALGFGTTWGALGTWYPERKCVAMAATTPEQFDAAKAAYDKCDAANADIMMGRIFGSIAWPVILPVQIGMRVDIAATITP